jgi:hypothetical protein
MSFVVPPSFVSLLAKGDLARSRTCEITDQPNKPTGNRRSVQFGNSEGLVCSGNHRFAATTGSLRVSPEQHLFIIVVVAV